MEVYLSSRVYADLLSSEGVVTIFSDAHEPLLHLSLAAAEELATQLAYRAAQGRAESVR